MLPGNYGAEALRDLLFGNANFVGKLPFTYPKSRHDLITYIHKPSEQTNGVDGSDRWMWGFGYGLSYTTFGYRDLTLSTSVWDHAKEKALSIKVAIKNTGDREGSETVMLFTSDLYASISPDVRRLRKFTQISLNPGEETVVTFVLTIDDLAFVNTDKKRVTERGEFAVAVGNLTTRFTLA
jgi:beta-glucosidase